MRFRLALIVGSSSLMLAAFGGPPFGAQSGQYANVAEIHVGGAARFDYLNVDSAGKRLYLSHGTEVVVIDLATNTVAGRIADTPGVHGIAIAPELGRVFTSNGTDSTVSIVDIKTLQTLSKTPTGGANPDAILYEPKWKQVWAFNHTGKSATAIDATTGKVIATIPLSGVAETGQADPALGRVFVNIEDTNSIDVIDVKTNKVVANWPVAPASSPTGMAIDTATHRLFVGGGPATVMIDATTGKVLASMPLSSGTDATWFDAGTKMVFSSCTGDGGVIIAGHVDGPDKLTVVQKIQTLRSARTMALDTATHRLYVAGQKYAPVDPNAPAAPPPAGARAGRGGPAAIPDSFHIAVFGVK